MHGVGAGLQTCPYCFIYSLMGWWFDKPFLDTLKRGKSRGSYYSQGEMLNDDLPPDSERYAVIEMGTKGIRLLVADISEGSIEQVVHSTGDLSQLGQEVDEAGNISPKSIRHVIE